MKLTNPDYDNDDALHDGEDCKALSALWNIYRDAGLSEEHARLSAAADFEDYFGCLTTCAA